MLVLAGGFGARLRPAVDNVPKPLAPVANRPCLHYLIENWVGQGVTGLTFLLHHQAELIEQFLKIEKDAGILAGCELRTLSEPEPLGTGGAVAYGVRRCRLTESFLVTNADTWLGSGLEQLFGTPDPALAVVRTENPDRFGRVHLAADRVTAFAEKQDVAGPGWINAGLYHLHPDLFASWNGRPFSLERELFPRLAAAGQLRAARLETDFIDIGVPEDYFRFCRWIESEKTSVL
jgi:D-glycero-alpha-D-manno-heptose 1-phosphate guanylyltransferase